MMIAFRRSPTPPRNQRRSGEPPALRFARGLSEGVTGGRTKWEGTFSDRKNERKGRLEKIQAAIGAFVADILSTCNDPEANGWTWRSLNKSGFTGYMVSFRDRG